MNLFRTTTFQLTALYAVVLAVSTLVVAVFLYWATIGYLQRQTDSTIEVEITGLREQYRVRGLNGLSRVIGERIRSGDDPQALYLFADRQLRPLAGNIQQWPDLVSRADGWYSFANDSGGTAAVPARARVLALPEGLVLLVGRDISDLDRLLKLVGTALAWSAGLAIALSLAGGVFMSSQVLKRIESINDTTRSIITGDLSQRVLTRGTRDEFDQLAGNLNRMLDQIEQLMGGIQHVGDSIAHDLRTPLTRLRHSLEVAAGGCVSACNPLSTTRIACLRLFRPCCASRASNRAAMRTERKRLRWPGWWRTRWSCTGRSPKSATSKSAATCPAARKSWVTATSCFS